MRHDLAHMRQPRQLVGCETVFPGACRGLEDDFHPSSRQDSEQQRAIRPRQPTAWPSSEAATADPPPIEIVLAKDRCFGCWRAVETEVRPMSMPRCSRRSEVFQAQPPLGDAYLAAGRCVALSAARVQCVCFRWWNCVPVLFTILCRSNVDKWLGYSDT